MATPGQRVSLQRSWREMFGVIRRKRYSLTKAHVADIHSDLEICITQREIYRMFIIMLYYEVVRDLSCVYM